MASIAPSIHDHDAHDGPRFGRVEASRQREALGLLLSGSASDREPSIQPFLDYLTQQQLTLDQLWVAREGRTLLAAVLIVPCPGRSGMLFCSPAASWPDTHLVVQLLRTACHAQSPDRVKLIQCLLDPPQQCLAGALRDAGFWDLATLTYMHRRISRRPPPKATDELLPAYRVLHWSESNREAFARAILASYEQTLDCPRLRGVRHIDDVIAGHMAAGTFHPHMWTAVYDADEPVGVMLVNELSQADAGELVYLGLAVHYRGQGMAKQLLEHGLDLAHAQGCTSMILAVDDRNEPAIRLYRAAGFRPNASKRALVLTNRRDATSPP